MTEDKIDYYYHFFTKRTEQSEFPYIDSFLKENNVNASITENNIYRVYRIPVEEVVKLHTPYNENGPYYLQSKYKRYPVFPFRLLVPLLQKGELNWKKIN